jgi:hypothetical protein
MVVVNGVAGFFNLLETNYKAQERLVAEQLRLASQQVEYAKEKSAAALATARWTKAMAIIAGVAIVFTVLVGLLGPVFSKPAPPIEVRLVAPTVPASSPTPAITPANPQSP